MWNRSIDTAYDIIDRSNANPTNPLHLHIQAVSEFTMNDKRSIGIFEQLVISPHTPSRFKDVLDMPP